jgi:hypothetical protein
MIRWSPQQMTPNGAAPGFRHGRRGGEARPIPRSMSGERRRACAEGGMMEVGELKLDCRLEQQSGERRGPWQGRRRGGYRRAGEMNERADRAVVVSDRGRRLGRRIESGLRDDRRAARDRRTAVEMYVSERNDELEGQRKQRETRSPSRTRSEPAHGVYASV